MSSQGRGSEVVAATVAVVCLLLVLNFEMAQAREASTEMGREARTYKVGGFGGWTFNDENWPRASNIHFSAGDVLEFVYTPLFHDVAIVNYAAYQSCNISKAPPGHPTYRTGKTRITLHGEWNYFICTFVGHCQRGMRIAVHAAI